VASFVWDSKNTAHIGAHGVSPEAAEYVVVRAKAPYPVRNGDRYIVRGRYRDGGHLQVAYVLIEDANDVDWTEVDVTALGDGSLYVIHAMWLSEEQKRRERRRRR